MPSLPNLHGADHLRHGVSSEREGGRGQTAKIKGRKATVGVGGTEHVRRALQATVELLRRTGWTAVVAMVAMVAMVAASVFVRLCS